MMKKFNQFVNEEFTTSYSKKYKTIQNWSYEYAKTNSEGFNSYADAIDYLDWFFNMINDLPNSIKLYRILQVDDVKDINKKTLGKHFTDNENNFDNGFLQSLGFSRGEIQEKKFYIVSILIDISQISLENTIATRLSHPYEDEYTLKENSEYKIIDIQQYIP